MSAIGPGERIVLRAFLEYELNQFPAFKRQNVTPDDYLKRCEDLAEENPCNFFCVQSSTNGGQTNAELRLTTNFDWKKGDYVIYLPPSPHIEFSGFYPKARKK